MTNDSKPFASRHANGTGVDRSATVLELDGIEKSFSLDKRVVRAVDQVSLRIDAGQFCALRGRSGCGKSTLLLATGGLLRPDAGSVTIQGQDLYAFTPERRAAFRAANIGFVFQQFHLVPYLTVLENILTATLGLAHGGRVAMRQRAEELIERFGLLERIRHRPAQLSTGERQRAALARALLNEPVLLLADEPTGNLDEENAEIVLGYLQQYAKDGGAVLLATHDRRAADRAHVRLRMADGRVERESSSAVL